MPEPSAPADAEWEYAATDSGGVVRHGGRSHATRYPRSVVELLVRRKGVDRMIDYLGYVERRGALVEPLLRYFEARGAPIDVLEPGCSAGHVSEALLRRPIVRRLVSFDADPDMVEVCREKIRALGLSRWEVDVAVTAERVEGTFDLVVLVAVMEHVDPALRGAMVRACLARLRPGGLLAVLESQNRSWPFEYHVVRLPIPFVHFLPPRWLYRLCRLLRRRDPAFTYALFSDPNTGWWGTSVGELRPRGARLADVSEELGFGVEFFARRWAAEGSAGRVKVLLLRAAKVLTKPFGVSPAAFLPSLHVVWRKE